MVPVSRLDLVSRHSAPVELQAPLRAVERERVGAVLEDLASLADHQPVAEDEKRIRRQLGDGVSPDSPLDHPDFCWREGHALIVGKVARAAPGSGR